MIHNQSATTNRLFGFSPVLRNPNIHAAGQILPTIISLLAEADTCLQNQPVENVRIHNETSWNQQMLVTPSWLRFLNILYEAGDFAGLWAMLAYWRATIILTYTNQEI